MHTYTLTQHVIDHLVDGERRYLSLETLRKVVDLVAPSLDRIDPRRTHQVAVILGEYDKPVSIGYSYGRRVILAVDIRRKTVCTVFARHPSQGKPKACQIMIDLEGNVVA